MQNKIVDGGGVNVILYIYKNRINFYKCTSTNREG